MLYTQNRYHTNLMHLTAVSSVPGAQMICFCNSAVTAIVWDCLNNSLTETHIRGEKGRANGTSVKTLLGDICFGFLPSERSAAWLFKSDSFPHTPTVISPVCNLALHPCLFLWSWVALIAPLIPPRSVTLLKSICLSLKFALVMQRKDLIDVESRDFYRLSAAQQKLLQFGVIFNGSQLN